MSRPPLPLGTHGEIRVYPDGKAFRARTLFRDYDGTTRGVERAGKTKGAARQALLAELRERVHVDTTAIIGPNTALSVIAEIWHASLTDLGRSPSTIQMYRERLDHQVLPALGDVRARELTVSLADRHLTAIKTKHGPAIAKLSKTVLSGICGLACRYDAMPANPCRDTARIPTKPKRPPRSLTVPEVQQFRAALTYDTTAVNRDLVDLIGFLAATGIRIGEACALTWQHIDLAAGTAEITGTVFRLTGKGLVVKPQPKTQAGARILELPTWCIDMLRTRHTTLLPDPAHPVFPAPLSGHLRDPSNTRRGIREAVKSAGYTDITSHTFRRTVATLMDQNGLTARAAADQLGHAQVQMTLNKYYGRKQRTTGAAQVLEVLNS